MRDMTKRSCAIAWHPHHLEHLIPLCILLNAHLVVASERLERIAAAVYPPVPTVRCAFASETGRVLLEPQCRSILSEFDVILYSHLLLREDLARIFGSLRDEPPRVVYCPHGLSEKPQRWSALAAFQDIALLHGTFSLDQLHNWGVAHHLGTHLLTGHVVRRFYASIAPKLSNAFEAEIAFPRQLSKRPRRILYTPTWNDRTGSSSFATIISMLLAGLSNGDQLLIKPHPLLAGEAIERLRKETEHANNIIVVDPDPRTIPYLSWADVLITDMSALAYDFLFLDKPMLFLNVAAGQRGDCAETRLFECGPVLEPDQFGDLYRQLNCALEENERWREAKATLYSDAFCKTTDEDLCRSLLSLLADEAPAWMHIGQQ